MTCPNCGRPRVSAQSVCAHCGKPIPAGGPDSAKAARPGARPPQRRPEGSDDQPPATGGDRPTPDAASAAGAPSEPRPGSLVRRDKSRDFSRIGKVIADRYKVLDVLGQGGFGTVYLVEITAGMVGEKLALKILPEELSALPAFRNQFLNEIRTAMRLVDRYIVQIRDVGTTEDGLLYYTMDFCPGTTLAHVVRKEGKISVSRVVRLVLSVLRGLQTAHAAGIIHRDLKPANIMVDEQGGKDTVKVLDFGIATAATTKGQKGFAGSPPYMPPEQFVGDEIGFYTDLYAVGVILYECITGQKPYPGTTAQEVVNRLKAGSPTPPENLEPEVAKYPGLSELILKSLERNPERRYQSAKELFDALNAVLVRGTTMDVTPAAPPAKPARTTTQAAAARMSEGKVRRRRAVPARRPSEVRVWPIVFGLLLISAVVLGVLFHREIMKLWTQMSPPAGSAHSGAGKTEKTAASGAEKTAPEAAQSTTEGATGKETPEPSLDAMKGAAQAQLAKRLLVPLREAFGREAWQEVVAVADKLLKADPKSVDGHRMRGIAALRLGQFAPAQSSLETALGLGADDEETILALARAEAGLSPPRLAEAEALVKRAGGATSANPGVVSLLALLLEKQEKTQELRELLVAARERGVRSAELDALHERHVIPELRRQRDEAQKLVAAGREAFTKGAYEEAAKLAAGSAQSAPSLEADILAAECRMELEQIEEGRKMAEAALQRARGAATSPAQDASLPEDLRAKPPAEEALRRLEGLVDYFAGKLALTAIAETGGADASALAETEIMLRKIRERDPALAQASADRLATRIRLALAELEALRGDAGGLVTALQTLAGEQDPAILEQAARLGLEAADRPGPKEKQVELLEVSVRLLGNILKQRAATKEQRGRASLRIGLGDLRLAELTGKETFTRQAIEKFTAAESAGEGGVDLYEGWGKAYDRAGNLIRAAQCFRKAYEVGPTPERLLRAVDAYTDANPNSPEARALLKEGKVRFKDNAEVQKR